MKTCIQRGAAPVAASSSSVQTEPWLRQKAVPAARGPRAARAAPPPAGPEQTGQAGWADDHRHAELLAEQGYGEVARSGARQWPGQQRDSVERRFVAPQRLLIL